MATRTNIIRLRQKLTSAIKVQEPLMKPEPEQRKQRSKSGLPDRYFISSARRALHDVHVLLDTDKTYELYLAICNKTILDVDVRDPESNMTALARIALGFPKWDAKKRQLWMRIFVKFGANANVIVDEETGDCLLAKLIIDKKEDVFSDLVEADVKMFLNFLAVNRDGNNLLHLAAYSRSLKMCNIIVARTMGYGVPLHEAYNHKGQTPLMIACENGDVAMAKTLIEAGADLTIREANCRYGSQMAIEILEETLIQNHQAANEAEVKQILERLIRSSCKFMMAAGQISKMARLLRWCATSILGQTKARELCQEFKPKRPVQQLVYNGPLPGHGKTVIKGHGVSHSVSSSMKSTPTHSGLQSPGEANEVIPPAIKAFDIPAESTAPPHDNDASPNDEQSVPQSVVYSLINNYSYLWTPAYVTGSVRTAERMRPNEHAFLLNVLIEAASQEDGENLGSSDIGSRLAHRMSLAQGGRGRQQAGLNAKLKRNLSNQKFRISSAVPELGQTI